MKIEELGKKLKDYQNMGNDIYFRIDGTNGLHFIDDCKVERVADDDIDAFDLVFELEDNYKGECYEKLEEENKKLREENELLKQCLDKLMFDVDVVNIKIHGELGDYVYVRSDRQFKFNVED